MYPTPTPCYGHAPPHLNPPPMNGSPYYPSQCSPYPYNNPYAQQPYYGQYPNPYFQQQSPGCCGCGGNPNPYPQQQSNCCLDMMYCFGLCAFCCCVDEACCGGPF